MKYWKSSLRFRSPIFSRQRCRSPIFVRRSPKSLDSVDIDPALQPIVLLSLNINERILLNDHEPFITNSSSSSNVNKRVLDCANSDHLLIKRRLQKSLPSKSFHIEKFSSMNDDFPLHSTGDSTKVLFIVSNEYITMCRLPDNWSIRSSYASARLSISTLSNVSEFEYLAKWDHIGTL